MSASFVKVVGVFREVDGVSDDIANGFGDALQFLARLSGFVTGWICASLLDVAGDWETTQHQDLFCSGRNI